MVSIKERLDRLEEMERLIKEKQKKESIPKRNLGDRLFGKKRLGKTWKLPKKITAGGKKKEKQNYAIVFYIRTNGYLDIYYAPIVNDMIYIKETGIYHAATAEYILRHSKYPVLIQPEDSLEPFSLKKHSKEIIEEGKISFPQKVIINAMKTAQLGTPNKMMGKTWLWILIGAIVILYLLSQVIGGGTP